MQLMRWLIPLTRRLANLDTWLLQTPDSIAASIQPKVGKNCRLELDSIRVRVASQPIWKSPRQFGLEPRHPGFLSRRMAEEPGVKVLGFRVIFPSTLSHRIRIVQLMSMLAPNRLYICRMTVARRGIVAEVIYPLATSPPF